MTTPHGLAAARADLADAIAAAGYRVEDHVPERITPPLVLMSTGDPYIEPSDTFGAEFRVWYQLFIVAPTGRNEHTTEALDTMTERVLTYTGEWSVTGVSAPFMAEHSGAQYLTARLDLGRVITIYNEGA